MKNVIYLDAGKAMYKGNLHLHTTWSDGAQPAEEVVEAFKAKGYHFISLSDHDIYTRTEDFDTEHFITLPGTERGELNPVADKNPGYHFGALDDPTVEPELARYGHLEKFPTPVPWVGDHSPQLLIDELRARQPRRIQSSGMAFDPVRRHGEIRSFLRRGNLQSRDGMVHRKLLWRGLLGSCPAERQTHIRHRGRRSACSRGRMGHSGIGGGWIQAQAESLTQAGVIAA